MPASMQQLPEQQSRRSRADDGDLCSHAADMLGGRAGRLAMEKSQHFLDISQAPASRPE